MVGVPPVVAGYTGQLPAMPDPPGLLVPAAYFSVYRGRGAWLRQSPGVLSGLIEDGSFVLGVDDLYNEVEITNGDYVEVAQLMDLTDEDLVSLDAQAVVPAVESGVAWHLKILVDGVEIGDWELPEYTELSIADLRAPVRRYSGMHEVAYRLELV